MAGRVGVASALERRPQPGTSVAANSPAARVQAEITRYGSLEAAVDGLRNDACGAAWDSSVHDILKEALAYQAEQRSVAQAEAA